MTPNIDRRSLLRSIGAGAITLTAVGPVSAGETTRYIVTTAAGGVVRRLERAGFSVTRELAGGDVLLVNGSGDPSSVRGVDEAVRDVRLRLERPERERALEDPRAKTDEESLYPLQWDKQTTNVAAAHDLTTGSGSTIAIIDTGTDLDHPDLDPNVVPGALFRRVAGSGPKDGVFIGTGNDVRLPKDPLTEDDVVTDSDGDFVGYDPAAFEIDQSRDASDDVQSHGTHVSGIAAASVGTDVFPGFTGIAGTAPDATVVPHRVFYWELITVEIDGKQRDVVVTATTTADILAAIDFAANTLGVEAMNMSIGTPPLPPQFNRFGFRQAYRLVIQDAVNAGSVVVVSAGNSGRELNRGGVFTVPNSVPGAMSISATGPNDRRVFYSNYGANEIDVGAPGGGYETLEKTLAAPYLWELIYGQDDDDEETVDLDGDGVADADVGFEYPTTDSSGNVVLKNTDPVEWPFPTNLVISTTPPDVYGDAYAYFAGTSMAAPQVAGTAALVAAANPSLNPHQIEQAIENGAKKATGQQKDDLGAGVLDALGAVEGATGRSTGRRS